MDVIETYLGRLSGTLVGPARGKQDLLAEARDGLVDAAEAYQRAGLPEPAARRQAVADFGPLRQVAAAFQTELALAQARRAGVLVVTALAMQPVLWHLVNQRLQTTAADGGSPAYAVLDQAVSWLGTIAVLAMVGAVLGSGVALRWWPPERIARGFGRAVLATCGVFALLGAGMALVSPAPHAMSLLLVSVLLLAPLLLVARSAGRCLVRV